MFWPVEVVRLPRPEPTWTYDTTGHAALYERIEKLEREVAALKAMLKRQRGAKKRKA